MTPASTITAAAVAEQTESLELQATMQIEAAEQDRPATFACLAYNGGVMRLRAHVDPTVIDLAGIRPVARVPLLADHRADLEGVLGDGRVTIDRARHTISIAGTLVRGLPLADQLVLMGKAGVEPQASIGGTSLRVEFVRAGQRVNVNGREFTGPLQVVREFQLREISAVAVGADSGTSVTVKAQSGETAMPPSTPTTDPAKAERERIQRIRQLTARANMPAETHARLDDIEAKAIDGEISESEVTDQVLGLLRASRAHVQTTRGGSQVLTVEVIAAAALLHAGFAGVAESAYGEQVTQQADDLAAHSVMDLCAAALQLDGRPGHSGRDQMISAAFSTMSLPTALGNAAEKVLIASFIEESATWESVAREMNLRNFKAAPTIRAWMSGQLQQVAPDGELKYVSVGETAGEIQADTFGAVIGITRKNVVNDDLGVFDNLVMMLGEATRRRMSDDAYTLLLSNPSDFFHADNGNYIEGSGTALSVAALSQAVQAMRKQTDENGKPLSLRPHVLLVPPELETTARAILDSTELGNADGTPTGNAMKGIAKLEVEPRLSNATFSGSSTTAWYLFAQPRIGALQVGYLNGRKGPVVDFFGVNSDPDRLGLSWRVYHDFGFALGEPRGAILSKGSA